VASRVLDMLTKNEIERYQRQIEMLGEEGQVKLKEAKVFIAGAGGLGSIVSIYLTIAGIGRIRMVDNDTVELTNLNRQVLHWSDDIGRKKAESAAEKLKKMNPNTEVEVISKTIDTDNVDDLVSDFNMIVDAMDNFPTRYLLNKTVLVKKASLFHGAVYGFYGQATTIIPGKTACLRCIFPEAPPPPVFPVIGVTPAIIGCLQTMEVIKYILGIGSYLENRLLIWDGLNTRIDEIALKKNPSCPDCS
jgi:adenylyltransferase/sulfurtransferase